MLIPARLCSTAQRRLVVNPIWIARNREILCHRQKLLCNRSTCDLCDDDMWFTHMDLKKIALWHVHKLILWYDCTDLSHKLQKANINTSFALTTTAAVLLIFQLKWVFVVIVQQSQWFNDCYSSYKTPTYFFSIFCTHLSLSLALPPQTTLISSLDR